ncbi:hypothetical protein NAEGRDRAFT_78011 [Naegleria gruberi]|uniref:Antistasin-like domain-containing protein n=1 Tax=Naegleria gruberi TaxID=5762 RepID=D2V076_NAEGR|nr:uncharacterized protein NAEGRDRAFT_78011 [Naegleria gruberi]EFC49668.1 hypothetical protein NAEGRDRAFT_78011 [Naegleria gruberi]|eukprot:XP_002682412.1 hypothetical protein NAEGRDRAFT_78011 [Naegleria gruberi strain NEG-M]
MKTTLAICLFLVVISMMVNLSYEIRNANCPMVKCARYCRHGYELNAKGCQTCTCVEEEVALSDISQQLVTGVCNKRMCRMYCPNGFKVNELGCPVCACKPAVACAQLYCFRHCENGYLLDERGCRTCGCVGEQN